jgi:integrase
LLPCGHSNGRSLQLDDESEGRLIAAAAACGWREPSFELFRDVVAAVRETGMRNQRELYRMRVENIDWDNKVIFVPDSKTPDGRRLVPMSDRVEGILRRRCGDRREGWVFTARRSRSGHIDTIGKRFREARLKAGLPESLVLSKAQSPSIPARPQHHIHGQRQRPPRV